MLAVAFIGILVGSATGARYAMGALIPLLLAALLGTAIRAMAGNMGEAVVGFGVFAIALQSAYVAAAMARTALRRAPRSAVRIMEENADTGFAPLRTSQP